MMKTINIGILIFNEVEVLDFAGPFEVFSIASHHSKKLFNVFTIAEKDNVIIARNGLKILPHCSFEDNVDIDILIIPGGYGAETIEFKNQKLLEWIIEINHKTIITASVCTGAIILAETKLLNGKKATTHWMDIDRLKKDYPAIQVIAERKYVEDGKFITSGGISAGINMSFYIIEKLYGKEVVVNTAKRMEYDLSG
ncbi:MAG: DJ-1/PfpI family protein [Acinetobacter populi]|jgi:transcriptional regulator GlxA family with amidase domain|uniref:DJ-1/PfpI family protein n=1 Tax=Acinetobacter populi TaxID=1582270 RepID=UPI00235448B0|nr:DJ-1/PfpI family protein [Acinetobacter populi]MCH4248419.1 DJ-1/PfpI family protein [Acinetobacter populi]